MLFPPLSGVSRDSGGDLRAAHALVTDEPVRTDIPAGAAVSCIGREIVAPVKAAALAGFALIKAVPHLADLLRMAGEAAGAAVRGIIHDIRAAGAAGPPVGRARDSP